MFETVFRAGIKINAMWFYMSTIVLADWKSTKPFRKMSEH